MSTSLRDGLAAINPSLVDTWDKLPPQVLCRAIDYARSALEQEDADLYAAPKPMANGAILAAILQDLITYGPQLASLISTLIGLFGKTAMLVLLLVGLAGASQPIVTTAAPGYHKDTAGTSHRVGGLKPLTSAQRATLKAIPKVAPTIAYKPAAIATVDLRSKCPPVLDQDGFNCCAGCSGTMGHRLAEILAGNPDPNDSVADLYDRCNGGRDQGADLDSCVNAMQAGVAPATLVPNWQIPVEKFTAGVPAARAANRLETYNYLASEAEMLAAVETGKPVYFGIIVTNQFNPNPNGEIGPYGGREEGGHAVLAIGATATANGGHSYIVRNSWGSQWGAQGNCYLDSSWAKPEIYGAFSLTGSLRTVASPPAPSGTKDVVTGLYYAPDPTHLPGVAVSLAGSASTGLGVASWQLSDSRMVSALTAAASRSVDVYVALNQSGGTGTAQHQAAAAMSAAGCHVYWCNFPSQIQNNFVVADGVYTAQGNYYFSPTAVQVGSYLLTVSGTHAASLAESQLVALLSGGTPALDSPAPTFHKCTLDFLQCPSGTCPIFPTAPTPAQPPLKVVNIDIGPLHYVWTTRRNSLAELGDRPERKHRLLHFFFRRR